MEQMNGQSKELLAKPIKREINFNQIKLYYNAPLLVYCFALLK